MKHLEDFLKRNRELAEAATPGEWRWNYGTLLADHGRRNAVLAAGRASGGVPQLQCCGADGRLERLNCAGPDAEFIAASRTSLPLALELLGDCVKALECIAEAYPPPHSGLYEKFAGAKAREALAALEEKAGRVGIKQ